MTKVIQFAGLLNVLVLILHLYFPSLLKWSKYLPQMEGQNRAVYLTFHYIFLFILLLVCLVSLAFPASLLTESTGIWFMLIIVGTYVIRFISEFTFFPWSGKESWVILGFCVAFVGCYGLGIYSNLSGWA